MAAQDGGTEWSRAEIRRSRHEGIERRKRWLADRDAFLEAELEPGEVVVARSSDHPVVIDRRILMAQQLSYQPRRGE